MKNCMGWIVGGFFTAILSPDGPLLVTSNFAPQSAVQALRRITFESTEPWSIP
jgi:hypothetical protein